MQRTLKTFCLVAAAVASIGVQATTISISAAMGSGWVAITPPGATNNNCYPCTSPINGVGTAFEAANVGWNSSASYNASAWAAYSGGWINASGITPFYARDVFNINGTPTSGTFTLFADDDSQLWVNGTLVMDDNNLGTGGNIVPSTIDITSFLHTGDNVIAFKAHNSAGGGFSVDQRGSVTFTEAPTASVPEPSSLALVGLGLLAAVRIGRRQVKQA